MSPAKGDWQTPEEILGLVRELGPIGLDPCTSQDNPVKARNFIALPHGNGLVDSWGSCEHGELIYCNPPYGRGIFQWVRRCREMAEIGDEVIALVPARTDAKWFQKHCAVPSSNAVCFWRGRLTFVGAPNPAPFPSAIVYWGDRPRAFCDIFSNHGVIWT